jgi:4'-phosphopantetheinyl transferase
MPGTEKLWLCTPVDSGLLPGDLEVWAAWLDATNEASAGFWSTLSCQERERAVRYAAQRERARFVVARGLLRAILGSALSVEPQSLEFLYSAKGKPSLGGAYARSGPQFNLAHSGGLGIFAVARDRSVGVDLEQLRPIPDLSDLIKRYLSPGECAELKKLSGEAELRGFLQIWTRKEAWLKATGEGITELLGKINVLGPSGTEKMCGGPQYGSATQRMRLYDLAPATGFLGALAVLS